MNIKINNYMILSLSSFGNDRCRTILVVTFFLIVSACSLKTGNTINYHTLDYPPPDREFKNPIPHTLMVYRFLLAPDVESDSILTSQAEGDEKSVRLHRWQENPADIVTDFLFRDLEASCIFRQIVDQLSNVRYRYALEGTLRNIHGIIKDGHPSALVELEVVLTDFDAPKPAQKDLLRKTYKVEIPSKDTSAESFLAAFNAGVKEISALLRADIRSAVDKRADAEGGLKKYSGSMNLYTRI